MRTHRGPDFHQVRIVNRQQGLQRLQQAFAISLRIAVPHDQAPARARGYPSRDMARERFRCARTGKQATRLSDGVAFDALSGVGEFRVEVAAGDVGDVSDAPKPGGSVGQKDAAD